jgi:hypothetical protein
MKNINKRFVRYSKRRTVRKTFSKGRFGIYVVMIEYKCPYCKKWYINLRLHQKPRHYRGCSK